MAIIKDFQIKAMKTFRGHEGEPLRQGNLYFKNKKVGFVSEDANGGYPNLHIDRNHQEAWEKASEAYLAENQESLVLGAEETFFYALLELNEDENQYKKAVKKGYSILAIFAEQQVYKYGDEEHISSNGREQMMLTMRMADVTKMENGELKGKLYKKRVYQSPDDFVIA